MSVKLIGKHEKDSRACRDALALPLNEMMAEDKSICYVDCALTGCINTKQLLKNYPDRALEALDAALADLPGDGRVRFPDRPRDAFQRCVPLEHVLDLQTLRVRDVFAHDGPPCCLPPHGIARRGQEDSHAGFSK